MKKKHFYEGMTPLPSDFDTLQQNTEDEVRGTAHAITGTGVLAGLEIERHKGLHLSIDKAHNNKFTIADGRLVGNKLYFSDNKKITIQVPLSEIDVISKVYVGSVGIGGGHTLYVSGWEIRVSLDKTLLVAKTNGSGFHVSDDAFDGFDVEATVAGNKSGYKLLTLEIVYQQPTSNNIYMTVGDVVVSIAGATGHHIGPGVAIAPNGQRLALLTGQTVTGSDGLVVLRYTQAPLDKAKDYTPNIRQERVWLNTYDVVTAEIVPHAKRLGDDVVLGEIKGGAVDLSNREVAIGWDTIVTLRKQMETELNTKIEQVKTELTTAVAQAKQEAQNAVALARTDAQRATNTAKTQAIDAALPVGFIYIQFPAQKEPSQLGWPGSWRHDTVSYGGAFFRAENGNASDFGVGRQGDAIRNISGNVWKISETFNDSGLTSGAFYKDDGGYPASKTPAHTDTSKSAGFYFDASRVVPTAVENRPINYTVRIWKRTA